MGKSNKDGNYFNGYNVYASNGKEDLEKLEKQNSNYDYSTVIGLVIVAMTVFCLYKTVLCKKK